MTMGRELTEAERALHRDPLYRLLVAMAWTLTAAAALVLVAQVAGWIPGPF